MLYFGLLYGQTGCFTFVKCRVFDTLKYMVLHPTPHYAALTRPALWYNIT